MNEQLALGFELPLERDSLDLVAGQVAALTVENRELAVRVRSLEIMIAHLSQFRLDPSATIPRRTINDRGHIVLLRDPAAAIRKAS